MKKFKQHFAHSQVTRAVYEFLEVTAFPVFSTNGLNNPNLQQQKKQQICRTS
jgi:hypothetical protein